MNTAVMVADGLGGNSGPTTLYRIDPPLGGADHLIVFHHPPMYGQTGQLCVIPATPDGQAFQGDNRPGPGSYATNEPNHHLALQLAGGYSIVDEEVVPASTGFDPSAHTVDEVNDYVAHSDEAEQQRVMEAERAGKARKGILGKDVV